MKDKFLYQCSNKKCNYIITELEYYLARFDFPCPKCEVFFLSEFRTIKNFFNIKYPKR